MEVIKPPTETADNTGRPETHTTTAGNFTVRPVVELHLLPSAGDNESIRYVPRTIADVSKFMLTKPA